MKFHISKVNFDLEQKEKRMAELTAELEVLRKEKKDLEVVFIVRTQWFTVSIFEILKKFADLQGAGVHRGRLPTQETRR